MDAFYSTNNRDGDYACAIMLDMRRWNMEFSVWFYFCMKLRILCVIFSVWLLCYILWVTTCRNLGKQVLLSLKARCELLLFVVFCHKCSWRGNIDSQTFGGASWSVCDVVMIWNGNKLWILCNGHSHFVRGSTSSINVAPIGTLCTSRQGNFHMLSWWMCMVGFVKGLPGTQWGLIIFLGH